LRKNREERGNKGEGRRDREREISFTFQLLQYDAFDAIKQCINPLSLSSNNLATALANHNKL